MKKWILFLILLLSISNLMCLVSARDYDQDHFFTKTKPDKKQLVGKYVPTEDTLSLIRDEGQYEITDSSITLYPDGSFEVTNMPDWWLPNNAGYGKSNGGFDSGLGSWKISSFSGLWEITLNFESGIFNSRNNISSVTLDLGGQQRPYSIWAYVGDPDRGRVMIFEQIVNNP